MSLSRILIDCDGPMADFNSAFCAALRRRGFPYVPEDLRHWDLSLSLARDAAAEVDTILRVPGFWRSLPRMPYARQLVDTLRFGGHEVVCVTSPYPSPNFYLERPEWLASLGFDGDDVMMVRSKRKALVSGDLLIEDHPGNAAAWCDANPDGVAILVDRPWNQPSAREFVNHRNVWRVRDDELFDRLGYFL